MLHEPLKVVLFLSKTSETNRSPSIFSTARKKLVPTQKKELMFTRNLCGFPLNINIRIVFDVYIFLIVCM